MRQPITSSTAIHDEVQHGAAVGDAHEHVQDDLGHAGVGDDPGEQSGGSHDVHDLGGTLGGAQQHLADIADLQFPVDKDADDKGIDDRDDRRLGGGAETGENGAQDDDGRTQGGIAPTTVLNTLLPVSFSPSPMFRQAVLDRPL